MQNRTLPSAAALVALLAAASAMAQSDQESDQQPPALLCAAQTVTECSPASGCSQAGAAEVGVPAFLRVDFADETVSDPHSGGEVRSTIDLIHVVDGQIVLHGTDPGDADGSGGTGWTATISEATGELLVSTVRRGAALLVFGACMVDE